VAAMAPKQSSIGACLFRRAQVRGLKRRRTSRMIIRAITLEIAIGAAIAATGIVSVSFEVSAAEVMFEVGCAPAEARGVRTVTRGWQVPFAQTQLSLVEGSQVYAGSRDVVVSDVAVSASEIEDDEVDRGLLLGGRVWFRISVATGEVLETRLETEGRGA
jgi:hypothetical protein